MTDKNPIEQAIEALENIVASCEKEAGGNPFHSKHFTQMNACLSAVNVLRQHRDNRAQSVEGLKEELRDHLLKNTEGGNRRLVILLIDMAIDHLAAQGHIVTKDDGWQPAKDHIVIERETVHPDDIAVDKFASAMKEKLAKKRAEGRGGWGDKEQCSNEFLSDLLIELVGKGDPVDVGNLAMMIFNRDEKIHEDGALKDALLWVSELKTKDASKPTCFGGRTRDNLFVSVSGIIPKSAWGYIKKAAALVAQDGGE